jgi:hypothetical protein
MVRTRKNVWLRNQKIVEYFLPEEIYSVLEELSLFICKFEAAAEFICN